MNNNPNQLNPKDASQSYPRNPPPLQQPPKYRIQSRRDLLDLNCVQRKMSPALNQIMNLGNQPVKSINDIGSTLTQGVMTLKQQIGTALNECNLDRLAQGKTIEGFGIETDIYNYFSSHNYLILIIIILIVVLYRT